MLTQTEAEAKRAGAAWAELNDGQPIPDLAEKSAELRQFGEQAKTLVLARPCFTDAKGREWNLTITVACLPFLRERGIALVGNVAADIGSITELATSAPERLIECIATCAKEFNERNLSPEDFAAGFDGEALDCASRAMMFARINFVPDALARLEYVVRLNEIIQAEQSRHGD